MQRLLVIAFLLAACGEAESGARSATAGDASVELNGVAARQAPDPEVLMQADRDFAAAVADGGSAAWADWFAADGAMIQPGVGEITGREAIIARMGSLDAPGVSLRWEPVRAEIAASGELGWTTGTYVSEGPGPDGEVARGEGRYVTIWRRAADGTWKVAMDLGNPTTPAAEAAADPEDGEADGPA